MPQCSKTGNCPICGSPLDLVRTAEKAVCGCCGATGAPGLQCAEGHFLCDACAGTDVIKAIESAARHSGEKDPGALAELLMNHPALPMIGCQHAFIAAASLLAALRNSRYAKAAGGEIREVFARTAKQAVDESCAGTGVCGIAPALGACFSVFLDARFGSDTEQRIVMESVNRINQAIAELTGPSCCKAYVRTALESAVTIFAERFGVVLPAAGSRPVCRHHAKHPRGCREEKCPYYRKESKDIFADSIRLQATVCHS